MFTVYIAKAAANFGLPATRPIYARAIEVLPDAQTAKMCLRFASLERKLGEIDRARAIYAHASQFCDPRTNAAFWTEWNAFESAWPFSLYFPLLSLTDLHVSRPPPTVETGSEDTFREMLRIKRAVQAAFNTEASYIAAQAAAARLGKKGDNDAGSDDDEADAAKDPMAALEGNAPKGPSFVAAKQKGVLDAGTAKDAESAAVANPDESAFRYLLRPNRRACADPGDHLLPLQSRWTTTTSERARAPPTSGCAWTGVGSTREGKHRTAPLYLSPLFDSDLLAGWQSSDDALSGLDEQQQWLAAYHSRLRRWSSWRARPAPFLSGRQPPFSLRLIACLPLLLFSASSRSPLYLDQPAPSSLLLSCISQKCLLTSAAASASRAPPASSGPAPLVSACPPAPSGTSPVAAGQHDSS